MNWENHFRKKSDRKNKKKQNKCQNAACEQKKTREIKIWFKQKN